MSYLEFFSLSEEPFSNVPKEHFFFQSREHAIALNKLTHAADTSKGLAILEGEIGSGKTTLARRFLDTLDTDTFEAGMLVIIQPHITLEWLLQRIATQLDIKTTSTDKNILTRKILERLIDIQDSGKQAIIIIDEAQMLDTEELVTGLRGLVNLESADAKLLTLILFGLPEMEQNLKKDPALYQRIAIRHRMRPFKSSTTIQYIHDRIKNSKGNPEDVFTGDAMKAVHRLTQGTPRKINTLCDNALLEAHFSGQKPISADLIHDVAEDLHYNALLDPEEIQHHSQNDKSKISFIAQDDSESTPLSSLKSSLKAELLKELKKDFP